MDKFFRRAPLVALVLALAVCVGPASAVEGDNPPETVDVVESTPEPAPEPIPEPAPEPEPTPPPELVPAPSEDPGQPPADSSGDSVEVPPDASLPTLDPVVVVGGGGSVACSGSRVEVGFENHDTLTVTSVSPYTLTSDSLDDAPQSLSAVVRNLFGSYTPRTQLVTTYYDGQAISVEEQIVPGVSGLDWEWITGVVLFLLMLYCLFRLLGGVMKYG